ncbi:MAG: BMP family ABC transporter substrate-binding protein [Candidatus Thorarchaeota archaeon]|nr:BMP family ABC transporter substrate-binding protein [Candidatus Thorarchaeota archaeon]
MRLSSQSNKFKSMVQSIEFIDHGGIILSSRSGVVASVIIVIVVFSAVGGYVFLTNQYVPSNIAVVVVNPGFGDRSMADQAYEGLHLVDVVVSYDIRVAADLTDLQSTMESIAQRANHDLILVIGTEVGLRDVVITVANEYPNQKFGFVGGFVNLPNVASATFAYNEASFLAGALAAHLAVENVNRTGVVGIIGSVAADSTVAEMISGFLDGIDYANQTLGEVKLLPTEYVNSYNDSETARTLAQNMWNPEIGNASVIFAPVRASIMGIRAAMEYANLTWFCNTTNREPFVIGAEADQRYLGNPDIEVLNGPSWLVTSIVPRSDLAVYRMINATLWGDFLGDRNYASVPLGENANEGGNLANDGIGLADLLEFQNPFWVTNTMVNMTRDYRLMIINGSITLP